MNTLLKKACAFILLGTLCINSMPLMAITTPEAPIIAPTSYKNYLNKATYGAQLTGEIARIYKALTALTVMDNKPIEIYLNKPRQYTVSNKDESKWHAKEKEQYELITKELSNNVEIALQALIKDYPEIFWLKSGDTNYEIQFYFSGVQNVRTRKYTFTINKLTFAPAKTIQQRNVPHLIREVTEALENFKVKGTTSYEKLKSIHDQLCEQLTYTLEAPNAHDIYGALVQRQCVCQGYAEAFKLLCDREGIPCVLVIGKGVTGPNKSEDHMWNYVKMEDNKWYAVDVTWDDQNNKILYDYFLVGSETVASKGMGGQAFSATHKPTGDFTGNGTYLFNYPTLNKEKYRTD